MSILSPNNNTGLIIDDFINYATAHLSTISGVVNTVSLYPPLATPGPGILTWSGYMVQPAQPSTPIQTQQQEAQETLELQTQIIQEDINQAKEIISEDVLIEPEVLIVEDYIQNTEEILVETEEVPEIQNELQDSQKEEAKKEAEKTPKKYSKSKNLDLIEVALAKFNINDTAIVKAVKANALKESGGQPIAEYLNYSKTPNDRIKTIFTKRATKYSDSELNSIKSNASSMGELMYGPNSGDVGKWLGNTSAGDGYKFRGRGFIQITGKGNYTANSLAVYKDLRLVSDPDILLTPEGAADSCAWFINRSLNSFSKKMGIATKNPSQQDANLLITSIIAGSPIKRSSSSYLASLVVKVDNYSSQV
jgi:hypothetical protein